MNSYLQAILTAAWMFPIVAVVFTFPYMVYQYRRHGAILMLRTVIVYSFILYCMCAYFLTMLPLPSIEEVAKMTKPTMQLIPFYDWAVWIRHSHVVLTQPGTWKGLLNGDLFQLVANIALTVPLGMYLRYYFRCSFRKTLLLSLCASLVFELTQLSGLFFIYPRPYRLFEVDDLMTNTFGGVIGFWLIGPLIPRLPTQERMDEVAYRRSNHVSVIRRLTADAFDWVLIAAVYVLLLALVRPFSRGLIELDSIHVLKLFVLMYAVAAALYFIIGEWLQRGYTPGKRLMRLRLIDDRDGSRPKLWQCAVRYIILYYLILPMPFVVMLLFVEKTSSGTLEVWDIAPYCVMLSVYAAFMVLVVIRVLKHSNQLPHGELSKSRVVSTLLPELDMLDTVGTPVEKELKQDDLPPNDPPRVLNE